MRLLGAHKRERLQRALEPLSCLTFFADCRYFFHTKYSKRRAKVARAALFFRFLGMNEMAVLCFGALNNCVQ